MSDEFTGLEEIMAKTDSEQVKAKGDLFATLHALALGQQFTGLEELVAKSDKARIEMARTVEMAFLERRMLEVRCRVLGKENRALREAVLSVAENRSESKLREMVQELLRLPVAETIPEEILHKLRDAVGE